MIRANLIFTGYGEDRAAAKKYNYKCYFDLELFPRFRVMHNKGIWSINISWLFITLHMMILYPIYIYDVTYYDKEWKTMLTYSTYNLRKAVWCSIRHGFVKIRKWRGRM